MIFFIEITDLKMSSVEAEVSELATLKFNTRTLWTCFCKDFGGSSKETIIINRELSAIETRCYL